MSEEDGPRAKSLNSFIAAGAMAATFPIWRVWLFGLIQR
jgi:hypothetical protein